MQDSVEFRLVVRGSETPPDWKNSVARALRRELGFLFQDRYELHLLVDRGVEASDAVDNGGVGLPLEVHSGGGPVLPAGGMTARGLSKLAEECGELLQVVGKKLAYYSSDLHPDGGPPLLRRLEDEMADVGAAMRFVAHKWGLDTLHIAQRRMKKVELFLEWDADVANNVEAVDSLGLGSL